MTDIDTSNEPDLKPHHARMMAIAAREYWHSEAVCSTLNRAARTIEALQAKLNSPAHAAKILFGGAPAGDLKVEFELVLGGWVGYVFHTPGAGIIVPAGRPANSARTEPCETMLDAIAAIPQAIDRIRAIAEQDTLTSG